MAHTQGELKVSTYEGGWTCVTTLEGEILFKLHLDNEDNAARLCETWNGYDNVIKQRDALVAACECVCRIFVSEGETGDYDGKLTDEYQILDEALTEIKGD